MSEMTKTPTLRGNWLPALVPVWDSAADPLLIFSGRPLICGSGPDCDLPIVLDGVKPCHCEFEFRSGVLTLAQAYSPVWINDVPARAGDRVERGDRVAVGSATFRVEQISEDADSFAAGTLAPLQIHAGAAARAASQAHQRDLHAERLQAWHDSLQQRSDDLSEQAQRLEDRFAQLLQCQTDYEERAHALEESQEVQRTERLEVESLRAQLRQQLEVAEQQTQGLNAVRQELDERALDLQRQREETEAQSLLSAEEGQRQAELARDLEEQREVLESRFAELEEQRAECEHAVGQQREKLAEDERTLQESLDGVKQEIRNSEQALSELQQQQNEQERAWEQRQAEIEQLELGLQSQLEQHQHSLGEQSAEERRLQALQADLDDRQRQVETIEEQIEARHAECDEREASLRTAFDEQEEAARVLEQEQQSVADRSAEVECREQSCADLERELQEREQELSARAEELSAERAALTSEVVSASEHRASIEELREEVLAERLSLEAWKHELDARHEEVAERVQELKRLKADWKDEQSQCPVHSLEEIEAERDALAAAKCELEKHVEELQQELDLQGAGDEELAKRLAEVTEQLADRDQSLQEETASHQELLEEVSSLRAEVASALEHADPEQDARIVELTDELASRNQEILDVRAELEILESRVEAADHELKAHCEAFDAEESELRQKLSELETDLNGPSPQEETLLRQVEELRLEVQAAESCSGDIEALKAREAESETLIVDLTARLELAEQQLQERIDSEADVEERDRQLAERDAVIQDLRIQLESQTRVDEADASADVSGWQAQLDERDVAIRELREQLVSAHNAPISTASGPTEEEISMRSRELDDRTAVLDRRDDELGDWNRRLQNTEEELEAERRQLQDARQQLELARAELQVSIDPPASEMPVDAEVSCHSPAEAEEGSATDETASHLRSELASLFGMNSGGDNGTTDPEPPDVSTEGGDSVVMSFEETHGVLLGPSAEETTVDHSDAEDSDYVTKYMEQLLARNRTSAGESLPDELSKPEEPEAPAAYEPKSFIEQYGEGLQEDPAAPARDNDPATETASESSMPTRQKIDLDALRHDMDSFRQVSVRSVQKALESHAMKKERSGLAGRQAVTVVLVLMSIFVAATHFMGIIDFPLLVWGLVIGSVAAAAELVRQTYAVKSRVKELTEPVNVSSGQSSAEETAETELTSADDAGAESDTEEIAVPTQVTEPADSSADDTLDLSEVAARIRDAAAAQTAGLSSEGDGRDDAQANDQGDERLAELQHDEGDEQYYEL